MSSCPGVPYSRRFAEHQNEGTPAEHDSKIDMTGPLALLLCSGILGMAQVSSSTSRGPMSISISITSLPPRFLEKRGQPELTPFPILKTEAERTVPFLLNDRSREIVGLAEC